MASNAVAPPFGPDKECFEVAVSSKKKKLRRSQALLTKGTVSSPPAPPKTYVHRTVCVYFTSTATDYNLRNINRHQLSTQLKIFSLARSTLSESTLGGASLLLTQQQRQSLSSFLSRTLLLASRYELFFHGSRHRRRHQHSRGPVGEDVHCGHTRRTGSSPGRQYCS